MEAGARKKGASQRGIGGKAMVGCWECSFSGSNRKTRSRTLCVRLRGQSLTGKAVQGSAGGLEFAVELDDDFSESIDDSLGFAFEVGFVGEFGFDLFHFDAGD